MDGPDTCVSRLHLSAVPLWKVLSGGCGHWQLHPTAASLFAAAPNCCPPCMRPQASPYLLTISDLMATVILRIISVYGNMEYARH